MLIFYLPNEIFWGEHCQMRYFNSKMAHCSLQKMLETQSTLSMLQQIISVPTAYTYAQLQQQLIEAARGLSTTY